LTIKTERDRSNKDDVVRKYIDSHRIF